MLEDIQMLSRLRAMVEAKVVIVIVDGMQAASLVLESAEI